MHKKTTAFKPWFSCLNLTSLIQKQLLHIHELSPHLYQ